MYYYPNFAGGGLTQAYQDEVTCPSTHSNRDGARILKRSQKSTRQRVRVLVLLLSLPELGDVEQIISSLWSLRLPL